MTDKVLEQRVKRLENKLDLSIEQDHGRLTHLEDVLASFIRSNQDGFARLRQTLEESQRRNDAESIKLRQTLEDSQRRNDAESIKLRQTLEDSQRRNDAEFAKFRQKMEESQRRQEESQRRNDAESIKLWQTMEESQRRQEESQRRNDAEFAKFRQEMADSQKRNDAGFAKLRQDMGYLSHRLGDLVEDLVSPSLPKVLTDVVGCTDTQNTMLTVRVRRRHPTQSGKMLEIDAIADCGSYVLFNETKNQLTPEKVKAFLDKLAIIRDYFPEYQHYTILGSVSAPAVEVSLIEYASRQGLFVLTANEGLMTLQNVPGFTWRAF